MKPYATEADALMDALRLSRAMTYKSAVAGLNLGGGKSVIMLDHPQQKTPELLKSFAERVSLLKGNYIGAGDVGSDTDDLRLMRQHSQYIVGLSEADGGLGDSAILTSLGVFKGIQAAVREQLNRDDLEGLKVAVQGAGKVGFLLVGHLLDAGCIVYLSDINLHAMASVKEAHPSVTLCQPQELFGLEVDVFSPNAIGGVITETIAHTLKAKIIAGGANNPLADESVASILHQRGILYAPDFVINAGGVIMVAYELEKKSFQEATAKTLEIYDTTLRVFDYARRRHLLPWDAAQHLATLRIQEARSNGVHHGWGQCVRESQLRQPVCV